MGKAKRRVVASALPCHSRLGILKPSVDAPACPEALHMRTCANGRLAQILVGLDGMIPPMHDFSHALSLKFGFKHCKAVTHCRLVPCCSLPGVQRSPNRSPGLRRANGQGCVSDPDA
jgi:hypothetical protein